MSEAGTAVEELADLHAGRRTGHAPPSPTGRLAVEPRTLLQHAGFGRILGAGAVGAALAGIFASPARADEALDVQMLQTSSSLEVLAVATYGAALTLPFIKDGYPVIKAFAEMTMNSTMSTWTRSRP